MLLYIFFNEDNEKCWGCQDDTSEIEIPMKTSCGHMSCSKCFYDHYVTGKRTICAICRKNVSAELFDTIILNNQIEFLHKMFDQDPSLRNKIIQNVGHYLRLAVKHDLFEMTQFLLQFKENSRIVSTNIISTLLPQATSNGNQQIINLLKKYNVIYFLFIFFVIFYFTWFYIQSIFQVLKIETDNSDQFCSEYLIQHSSILWCV